VNFRARAVQRLRDAAENDRLRKAAFGDHGCRRFEVPNLPAPDEALHTDSFGPGTKVRTTDGLEWRVYGTNAPTTQPWLYGDHMVGLVSEDHAVYSIEWASKLTRVDVPSAPLSLDLSSLPSKELERRIGVLRALEGQPGYDESSSQAPPLRRPMIRRANIDLYERELARRDGICTDCPNGPHDAGDHDPAQHDPAQFHRGFCKAGTNCEDPAHWVTIGYRSPS
jgi:hypothetical protein